MKNLTLANQLTILRIALIPAFVLLVVYRYLGAALLVFSFAGLTDALDGLIARRAGQRTSLGAWLDPMADKLLLLSTFIMLTLPTPGQANRLPVWLTVTLALAAEVTTTLLIRDGLALNVLMLVWPVESIKHWQAGL